MTVSENFTPENTTTKKRAKLFGGLQKALKLSENSFDCFATLQRVDRVTFLRC